MTVQPSEPGPRRAARRVAAVQLRGRAGPLSARAYWPGSARSAPGLSPPLVVLFPGDPRVPAGLDRAEPLSTALCAAVGAVVLTVAYRPPDQDPDGAREDAVTATRWAADHARELAADPGRLVVAGEGFGAGLAAAVVRQARDQGWPPIRRQILIRPGPLASAGAAGPAEADVAGVAPATVVDGRTHAARLRRAGVEADEVDAVDLVGGDGAVGERIADGIARSLRRSLAVPGSPPAPSVAPHGEDRT